MTSRQNHGNRIQPLDTHLDTRQLIDIHSDQDVTSEHSGDGRSPRSRSRLSPYFRKKGTSTEVLMTEREHDDFINFVQKHFKINECVRFVQKPEVRYGEARCYCGEVKEKHYRVKEGRNSLSTGLDNSRTTSRFTTAGPEEPWSKSKDIKEFPSNAFGKIEFVNEGLGFLKAAKYIRLHDSAESVNAVTELMVKYWKLQDPKPANLVISVVGGAKNFKLDGSRKEIFNRGLIKAAQTTNAWLITSGFNMGVMKAVGEAVREGQTYTWDSNRMTHSLRCIGIAPWGYVEQREYLVSEDLRGKFPARYKASTVIHHGRPVSLNPSHTHFFLVDNGTRNTYNVGEFRAKLERKIALPRESSSGGETGLGIPVILVCVEGGFDAIIDCNHSIKANIPLVVCEGTGRAADIVAYAYNNQSHTKDGTHQLTKSHQAVLTKLIRTAFGETWRKKGGEEYVDKQVDFVVGLVLECCCRDHSLITIFDMNRHEALDHAILSALLKAKGNVEEQQRLDQLKLALTWNRTDIAEEKIFKDDQCWSQGSLDKFMKEALVENKVDFVRLLLQNGMVMKEYLTVPRLRDLYNLVFGSVKVPHLKRLFEQTCNKTSRVTLQDVSRLLRKLLGKHIDEIYMSDTGETTSDTPIIRTQMKSTVSLRYEEEHELAFDKPFRELFIWAVLMNRQNMAKFFWERGDDPVVMSLIASQLYSALESRTQSFDSDLKKQYQQHKKEFEHLAVRVIDDCHEKDEDKALMLLERQYPVFGNQNCLELAAAAEDKEFLSTVCCQNRLNLIWKGAVPLSWFRAFICTLLPPLVLFLVPFHENKDGSAVKWGRKLWLFYRSPMIKFVNHTLLYIIFLGLYSYMLLFNFKTVISPLEWLLIGWIVTMLLDELREMAYSTADNVFKKILEWWRFSVWNQLDLVLIILALVGFTIRMMPGNDYYNAARLMYCINCVLYYVRLLRVYTASSYLGPKLVMIKLMVIELVIFILILIVALLAYGVASQALTYPTREPVTQIFKDIFYYPYWQLYGELFLDEIGLQGPLQGCEGNSTVTETGEPCPTFSWLVPLLLAMYLLIGNVLLLNLLIAIFSHVFNEVNENAIEIWKYDMYFLVMEYQDKPGLAPPFIIIEHVVLFFKFIARKTCTKKSARTGMQISKQNMMTAFEKEIALNHAQKTREHALKDNSKTVLHIQKRTDEIAKMMQDQRMLNQEMDADTRDTTRLDRSASIDSVYSTQGTNLLEGKRFARWPTVQELKALQKQADQQANNAVESGAENHLICTENKHLTTIEEQKTSKKKKRKKKDKKHEKSTIPKSHLDEIINSEGMEVKHRRKHRESLEIDSEDEEWGTSFRKRRKHRPKSPRPVSANSDIESFTPVLNRRDSDKFLNTVYEQAKATRELNGETRERVANLEERISKLEETTSKSLSNIESMLQNMIFSKSVFTTTKETPTYSNNIDV